MGFHRLSWFSLAIQRHAIRLPGVSKLSVVHILWYAVILRGGYLPFRLCCLAQAEGRLPLGEQACRCLCCIPLTLHNIRKAWGCMGRSFQPFSVKVLAVSQKFLGVTGMQNPGSVLHLRLCSSPTLKAASVELGWALLLSIKLGKKISRNRITDRTSGTLQSSKVHWAETQPVC